MKKKYFEKQILFGILFLIAYLMPVMVTKAAEPVKIKEVNYDTQTITLEPASANDIIYYSDYKKKKWEMVNGVKTGSAVVMDISWIPMTKDYELCFKTDKNDSPYSIFLPKQAKDFKAIFNKETGKIEFENDRGNPILWRKNLSSEWKPISTPTSGTFDELPTFYAKGATLYFRTGQIIGTDGNTGTRPSKECKLAIPKRTTGPTLKIDGSKLTILVPTNTIYNVDGAGEKQTSESQTINLSEIAPDALAKQDASTNQYPDEGAKEVSIAARTKGTSSKAESKTEITKVPKQKKAPDSSTFVLKAKSTTTFTIELSETAKKATGNPKPAYEYTIVKENETLDYTKAVWTALSSTKAATITDTVAPKDSTLYIREKMVSAGKDIEFALASAPYVYKITASTFAGSSSIKDGPKKYSIVKGMEVPNDWRFTVIPTTETDVKSITYKSTPVDIVSYGYDEKTRTIDVRITGISKLESMLSYIGKELPLVITLENGDKIEDSVYLTINEETKVTKKIFNLIRYANDQKVEFKLTPPSKTVQVSSVKYEGMEVYDAANSTVSSSTYTIALSLSYIYTNCRENKLGEDVPVTITMSNGEVLDDVIFINVREIASVAGGMTTYTLSDFKELELATLNLTNSTKATIQKVTWNGKEVNVSSKATNTTITITLEKNQPNLVGASGTYPLIICFSNGARIEKAYELTLTGGN